MHSTKPTTGPALHIVDVPVRWSDLDADGRVNNVLVLRFAEEARMQWTSVLGTSTEAPELMPVVVNVGCTFHTPIGYPATVRVSVHCTRIGRSSVDLCFEIRDASNPEVHFATATAVWVWVDKRSGRSAPAPASLRERCNKALSGMEMHSEP
ncbi:thioesterase family protein [Cupriavidus sp. BIC8F]|uniref:acyl-CoA thioesterase n=1 Tax=Cupriavidus sp. BIC8F TaxID=3079014 RepID=UPI002916D431|nr:thioesterase family protein [Cupriavidus sp. BIC8F]